MTDDTLRPDPNDRPEQVKPEYSGENTPQRQADVPGSAPTGVRPSAPGRRPLFRS